MKQVLLPIILILAITFTITGCKNTSQKQNTDTIPDSASQNIPLDTVATANTLGDTLTTNRITYDKSQDSTIKSIIRLDYPTGNDSISIAVKTFLARQLASLYLPQTNGEDAYIHKYPVYKGSIFRGQQMVGHYGKGTLQYLSDSQKEMLKDMGDSADHIPFLNNETTLRKEEETADYITYRITRDTYLGGAHGSYLYYCVNISKHTLKPIEQTIDTTRLKALQPLLRKGICRYLRECGENVTNTNLNTYLFLPENELIPLPAFTPWLSKEGVNFVYQQYEIAPYALGLVSFTIPYKQIRTFFFKELKAYCSLE